MAAVPRNAEAARGRACHAVGSRRWIRRKLCSAMTRVYTYQKPAFDQEMARPSKRHLKELRLDHNQFSPLFEKNK